MFKLDLGASGDSESWFPTTHANLVRPLETAIACGPTVLLKKRALWLRHGPSTDGLMQVHTSIYSPNVFRVF